MGSVFWVDSVSGLASDAVGDCVFRQRNMKLRFVGVLIGVASKCIPGRNFSGFLA